MKKKHITSWIRSYFDYFGDVMSKLMIDNRTGALKTDVNLLMLLLLLFVPAIRENDSAHSFADSQWHHLLLAWDVKSGILRFYVDSEVALNGQTTQYSEPFPGGRLILGQTQDASGAIYGNESLKADIMHFNMWQRVLTEQEIIDIYSECNVNIGTLVPWPEMLLSLHGNVTRIAFVRCFAEGMTVFVIVNVQTDKQDILAKTTSIIPNVTTHECSNPPRK